MTDTPLWDEPEPCRHGRSPIECPFCHARGTDPSTSHIAAATSAPMRISQSERIYQQLAADGTGTQSSLAEALELLPHQVNKRLADLHRAGRIRRNGETRSGHAGNPEKVWVPT